MIVIPLTLWLPAVAGLGAKGVFLAEPISNFIGGKKGCDCNSAYLMASCCCRTWGKGSLSCRAYFQFYRGNCLLCHYALCDLACIVEACTSFSMISFAGLGAKGVFLAEPISNFIGGTACFVTMLCVIWPALSKPAQASL